MPATRQSNCWLFTLQRVLPCRCTEAVRRLPGSHPAGAALQPGAGAAPAARGRRAGPAACRAGPAGRQCVRARHLPLRRLHPAAPVDSQARPQFMAAQAPWHVAAAGVLAPIASPVCHRGAPSLCLFQCAALQAGAGGGVRAAFRHPGTHAGPPRRHRPGAGRRHAARAAVPLGRGH